MLYLDNSATTRIYDEVLEALLPFLKEEYGNPSSKYYLLAENAKKAISTAREKVAELVGCDPEEVIFTSGATESNNMIIKGVADQYPEKGNHIITSKVEHPSVIESCKHLESKGYKVTYLDVDLFGRIQPEKFEQTVRNNPPLLVSLIWGNNELGSLNEVEQIAAICKNHNVLFHTDATQIIGKVKFNLSLIPGIRFLSISGHKIHAPKGVGVAIIRKHDIGKKTQLTPLIHGGGQEDNYRSGTLAVHNIVGLGKAAEIAMREIDNTINKLLVLEAFCKELLVMKFGEQLIFNSDTGNKIPGLLNLMITGVNNQRFIIKHAEKIAISTGSACSSAKPSEVLIAIGKSDQEIRSTLRITLSPDIELSDLKVILDL
ncbi:MAG TPA: cysteine desulfurase family protein [Bacilli bacterium]